MMDPSEKSAGIPDRPAEGGPLMDAHSTGFPPSPRPKGHAARLVRAGCALLCCALLLSACGARDSGASPTDPPPRAASTPFGSAVRGGALSDKLLAHLTPLKDLFNALGQKCFRAYGWTIPRDMLTQCASDIATHHISEEDGLQVCTAVHASRAEYTASGMDDGLPSQSLSTLTPEEKREDAEGTGDMDTSLMGDFVGSGGGDYVRTVVMRLAPDASFGTAETDLTLNGAQSGRESFVFLVRDNTLYFYDAAQNVTAFDQDGNTLGDVSWLITCGQLSPRGADVAEYAADSFELPLPEALPAADMNAAAARPGALRLKVLDGTGRVTREGEVLEEFDVR